MAKPQKDNDKSISRDVEKAVKGNISNEVVGNSKEIRPEPLRGDAHKDEGKKPVEHATERLIRVSLRLDSGLEHNMSLPLSTVQDIMNRQTSDFFLEIPVQRYENVNQPIKHRLMHTSRIREIDIFDEV